MRMLFDDNILEDQENQVNMVPMIFPEDGEMDYEDGLDSLPEALPIIPLRSMILFPAVTIPVMISRDKSKRLVNYLESASDRHVLVATQVADDIEDPTFEDLIPTVTVGEVLRVMQVQDDTLTIIVQGKQKAELTALTQRDPFMMGSYRLTPDLRPTPEDMEYKALISSIKETIVKILILKGDVPKPLIKSISEIQNEETLLNFACANFPTNPAERISFLLLGDLKTRAYRLLASINKLLQMQEMRAYIQQRTRTDMDKQQKDYYLHQQMKVIREELNETEEDDSIELLKKAKKKKWNKNIAKIFQKEVKKLQRMSPQSPDYGVHLQYLNTMLDLPWNHASLDNFDIDNAEQILDRDHFGLEKVKERILEHLAVLKLKGDLRAPIICLYGPPGVGKTSLGQSIASALGREYVRISLGGLHDESEIRGHRRTYIGALPGRIIKGFVKAGTANPVFVLDEIDKLSQDYKGDPASALLEVLDPEQNSTFHDNYLDVDYDLSKALFIATANSIGNIPGPLRDRMEMIEVSGYILEEKVEIAHRHLLPKALSNHGLDKKKVKISKKTLSALIEQYTKESGVRELEKRLSSLMRKIAKKVAAAKSDEENTVYTINPDDLYDYLGAAKYQKDLYEGNKYAGVVTGLAWTSVGGEILLVESAITPSKSGKMSITGNLGEVMKESAVLALEYIKSHCYEFDITPDVFDWWNVHIHVPEGAIPKDGPSAGITLVTSLISTFTQRKVRPSLAMTGEITLRGKVLPVGGIKEKILAAKRAGIKTIILCQENRKDVEEIKDVYLSGLKFVYVSDVREVIEAALMKSRVTSPVDVMKHVLENQKRVQAALRANTN